MMSVSTVSAGAASSGYYKAEGYYVAGSEEADAAARWFGKAAEAAGLSGRIDDAKFTELLEGYAPNGQVLGRYANGERQHRPGLDLTFSAPKGVSIAGLVMGDERVINAHDKAVERSMAYVEGNLIQTRRQVGQDSVIQDGGKVIAGLFRHDTSRALDPQLHTHAVITNMVEGEDGKFTAIHNDKIFRTRRLATEIYRNELARGLNAIGYETERRGKHGVIDIKGLPNELIEGFSKRRQQIQDALKNRDQELDGRSSSLAALATRAAKHGGIDRGQLKSVWEQEAERFGLSKEDGKEFLTRVREQGSKSLPGASRDPGFDRPPVPDARAAVQKAISHISERESVYKRTDLEVAALQFAKSAGHEQIGAAVLQALKSGQLIDVSIGRENQRLTDRDTLTIDREMIRAVRGAARTPAPQLVPKRNRLGWVKESGAYRVKSSLERTSLTEGQKNAIQSSLTGRGLYLAIQGYAGTGKTTMLSALAKEVEKHGLSLEGLAPSQEAVRNLAEAVPGSKTLQSVLTREAHQPSNVDKSKSILVLDEASMVSARDMQALVTHANKTNYARVVLVGDIKQLDAVGAGSPFHQLQAAGVRTAYMTDIQRQRDDNLKTAVGHAISGEVTSAFKSIGDNVSQSKRPELAAAASYLALDPEARISTGIIAPTNSMRQAINDAVREGLKARGDLTKQDTELQTLEPLNLSRTEAAEATSYKRGDVVIPLQNLKTVGLENDQIYVVADIDSPRNAILVQSHESAFPIRVPLSPKGKAARSLVAYEATPKEFSNGDQVRLRITDKALGIANGERAKIADVSDTLIRIEKPDGTTVDLPRDSLAAKGIDHAYALTTHGFQGSTVDRIIVAMKSSEQLATQKSFYVAISRARDAVELHTDNTEALLDRLKQETGIRPVALEAYVKSRQKRQELDRAEQDHSRDDEKVKTEEREPQPDKSQAAQKSNDGDSEDRAAAFFKDIERDISRLRDRGERTR